MKVKTKLLSVLLAFVMLLGTVSTLGITITVSAEETSDAEVVDITLYPSTVYENPDEKIATMTKMLTKDGYDLYVDKQSGEVAVKELASGNYLFSNPYDVGSSSASYNGKGTTVSGTKTELLSQLIVSFTDTTGITRTYDSFSQAAIRGQIEVIKIKNGVRIEYVIGQQNSRLLVPHLILASSFEELIEAPLKSVLSDWTYNHYIGSLYSSVCIDDTMLSSKSKNSYLSQYPVLSQLDENDPSKHVTLYILSADASNLELLNIDAYIKQYCENYTFEQLEIDHEAAGYEEEDKQYPVFKMALEYHLDEDGLSVSLPCNGLRYDMSAYTLEYISILPYMGTGSSENPGYNFYPDGSGSLFDFEQLDTNTSTTIRGKVYGVDFAYHEISGATYQKTIRYPIYGTVATDTYYTYSYTTTTTATDGTTETVEHNKVSNTVKDIDTLVNEIIANSEKSYNDSEKATLKKQVEESKVSTKRGYLAIIEEGDSLAEIATYHAGTLSEYNTMRNYFNPKPKDSYDLSDSIAAASDDEWTVVSDRKYTGNITIRYIMLCDETVGETTKQTNEDYLYYETSWFGMAEAYRDYLIEKGDLTRIDDEDLTEDIPLYIEVFGAMKVQKTIATIPVMIMTPFTTFEDLYTMYEELSAEGIKNINFKMTGFANGGMYYTVPSSLNWVSAVGGKSGFKKLLEKAEAINSKNDGSHLGLYPDFDFAYIQENKLFDNTILKKDAVKTIDDRYTSLRSYSATAQDYVSFYQLAVSPSRYSKFYTKLLKNYSKYDIDTISVASLGTALNSDFDEDEPYNREDSKEFTETAMQAIKDAGYTVMSEDANAYTIGSVSHLLNVSLDSSRYVKSAASVPFVGVVLHGYVQFAGSAYNEEGDTSYAMLRAIENGASLYFILSYENTEYLKEDSYYSQYYSVRYDIWKDDVVDAYEELNSVLKDVQNKLIVKHEFLTGERILDIDELIVDIEDVLEQAIEEEDAKQKAESTASALAVANAWSNAFTAEDDIDNMIDELYENLTALKEITAKELFVGEGKKKGYFGDMEFMSTLYIQVLTNSPVDDRYADDEYYNVPSRKTALASAVTTIKNALKSALSTYENIKTLCTAISDRIDAFEDYEEIISNASGLTQEVKDVMLQKISEYKGIVESKEQTALDYKKTASSYVEVGGKNSIVDLINDEFESWFGITNWADTALESVNDLNVNLDVFLAEEHEIEINPTISTPKSEEETSEGETTSEEEEEPKTAEEWIAEGKEAFLSSKKDFLFTYADILKSVASSTGDDSEEEEEETTNRYIVDNNKIVAVTYGDRDDATFEKTYYKTFLLNYNTYAVRVTYDGIVYTIPAGGYIVIYATYSN